MADEPRPDDGDHLPVPFEPEWVADDPGPGEPGRVSRRQFLTFTVAGGAAVSAAGRMSRGQLARHARRAMAAIAGPAPQVGARFLIHAERDIDLVTLDFEFVGFTLQAGDPPRIVPRFGDAQITVFFPPQAIGEAVYFEVLDGNLLTDPAPILSEMAGPSRLVFNLPPGGSIPLPTMTVADLLDWSDWRLKVPAVARAGNIEGREGPFSIQPPNAGDTRIECPYALYLSPTEGAVFDARTEPLLQDSLTDCWGATLVRDPEVGIVAAWARDYKDGNEDATPYSVIDYGSDPG